ncbi:cartilage intermediate layer protein 1-like [Amblyraja radiata]|uniref:cartilage intermediate layer protein 1-like n=1 Tax=Amblyraja radiata TaxID=386614 RepID=UPI0014041DCC|nr:cartilage intermediate layer protein 1-like [Amblyraja radiata]
MVKAFLVFITIVKLCTNNHVTGFRKEVCCKTEWFDRDDPSGNGDYELLADLQKENPGRICTKPIACEVETTKGVPASQTGENFASCNASTGFFCVNKNQRDGSCQDYRIRFHCPDSYCEYDAIVKLILLILAPEEDYDTDIIAAHLLLSHLLPVPIFGDFLNF